MPSGYSLSPGNCSSSQITLCISVFNSETRPWIVERLRRILEYYSPLPPVVVANWVVPGGSNAIEALCEEKGILCVPVPGGEFFAPGIGRNRAFEASTTPLVCFCDADFFMERDFFARANRLAGILGWETQRDLMVNLPAFHLGERCSEDFFANSCPEESSAYLARIHEKCLSATSETCLFAVPYSNVFLCHRDGFNRSGGFNEVFSGHGSEDFEFLLRFARITKRWPLPHFFHLDLYAPRGKHFFTARGYHGFRRLFEAMSFPAESNGLRTFHMYHPIDQSEPWMRKKDRHRVQFLREVAKWTGDGEGLLQADWLGRTKKIVTVLGPDQNADVFLPLREQGSSLEPITWNDPLLAKKITALIESDAHTAVAVSSSCPSITELEKLLKTTKGIEIPLFTVHHENEVNATDTVLAHSYIAARLGLSMNQSHIKAHATLEWHRIMAILSRMFKRINNLLNHCFWWVRCQ